MKEDFEDEEDETLGLASLEGRLGAAFKDRDLLREALRHSSYSHERATRDGVMLTNNERLEFLGDSVLGLVVANALFRAKPEWREGELSRALHALVEGRSLARLAASLELGPLIKLGRTEQLSGGPEKPSILADTMEAIIGAMFLDRGLPAAVAFIENAFGESLKADAPMVGRDPKTELQERSMAGEGEFPTYRMVEDSLIEGDEKRFTVEVLVHDRALANGVGRTKRAAERLAAEAALSDWPIDPLPKER
ncbi:MAG: ribonuclease III [Myxococcota bacterium]